MSLTVELLKMGAANAYLNPTGEDPGAEDRVERVSRLTARCLWALGSCAIGGTCGVVYNGIKGYQNWYVNRDVAIKHLDAASEDLIQVCCVALAILAPVLLARWIPACLDNVIKLLQSIRDLSFSNAGNCVAQVLVRKVGIVAAIFFGGVGAYKSIAQFTLEPGRFNERK